MRFKYYIDYGSGWIEISPKNTSLKLAIKREINPYIQRKSLEGSFSLSELEAATAYDYFILNSNNSAPFQIKEGLILVFNGEISLSGFYDISANIMRFDKFKTIDEYSPIVDILSFEIEGENMGSFGTKIYDFTSQGVNANSDKLKAFSYSGGNFSTQGNIYSLNTIGRPSMCMMGTHIVVYDEHSRLLRAFDFDGTDYTPASIGTSVYLPSLVNTTYGAATLISVDSTHVSLFVSGSNIRINLAATTGTWTLSAYSDYFQSEYPSAENMGSGNFVFVDELSNELKGYGGIIEIGETQRPKVCKIDTNKVVVLNCKTGTLQAYLFAGGKWDKTGTSFSVGNVIDASICQAGTNIIHLHDTSTGTIRYYSFDGTNWTQTGTGTSHAGGLTSAIIHDGTYTHIVVSDSHVFSSRISPNIEAVINDILDEKNLTNYEFAGATCGASFDIESLFLCDLQSVTENPAKSIGISNNYKYSIGECLKIAEIFQNYWYLELVSGKYQFKFKTPNQFSSTGIDIDVSSLGANLNQRNFSDEYFFKREKITFQNEFNADFIGDFIEYDKNTIEELLTNTPYTTDLGYIVDIYNQRLINKQISKNGLLLIISSLVESGTSPLSNENVRNEKLSKTRIYEDYLKDYRYVMFGQFLMNGNNVSVQDTCKPFLNFPDVQIKLDTFPNSIASLNWDGRKSYVTSLEMDLSTFVTVCRSVLLDL